MAASDWLAGYEVVFERDGVAYPMRVASASFDAKMINRSNSKYSAGYTVNKAGVKSLTLNVQGPYKQGEAPISVGAEETFSLKPSGSSVAMEFLGVISNVKFDDDVEDGPSVSFTIQNSEEFDPVIS